VTSSCRELISDDEIAYYNVAEIAADKVCEKIILKKSLNSSRQDLTIVGSATGPPRARD